MTNEEKIAMLEKRTTLGQINYLKDKADIQKDINQLHTDFTALKGTIDYIKDKANRNQDDIDDLARGTDLALKDTEYLKTKKLVEDKPFWKIW